MGKILKIKEHFGNILQEVVKADVEFKLHQQWFDTNNREFEGPIGKEAFLQLEANQIKETSANPLAVAQIELQVYLKKYKPSFFTALRLKLQRIELTDLYSIATQADADM